MPIKGIDYLKVRRDLSEKTLEIQKKTFQAVTKRLLDYLYSCKSSEKTMSIMTIISRMLLYGKNREEVKSMRVRIRDPGKEKSSRKTMPAKHPLHKQ